MVEIQNLKFGEQYTNILFGGIYSVSCPLTNSVFYVGQTIDLKTRKLSHERGYDRGKVGQYEKWILSQGFTPVFEPLETIVIAQYSPHWLMQKEYMSSMEVYWIEQIKAWGFTLLNTDFMRKPKIKHQDYFNYKYAS